jgi:uncharacterized repeat protein (TIGR03803 family)
LDANSPYAGVVEGTDGNLYGTTTYEGMFNVEYGRGTVFTITAGGAFTSLYTFCAFYSDCQDGEYPIGGLVQGRDGYFYGTTEYAGAYYLGWAGTAFKISSDGALTTLYSFCAQANCTDGAQPDGTLIQATDGNLYGTTSTGGASSSCIPIDGINGCGSVFRMTPDGVLTTLHSFDSTDGASPYSSLSQATSGSFYGTTLYGGSDGSCYGAQIGCGTIFGLYVGLAPFVETLPKAGKVGTSVRILGTALKETTSVTFNGTAAAFKVVSGSLISTAVPTSATTGPVQVVTPSGTLTSNVNFQVLP